MTVTQNNFGQWFTSVGLGTAVVASLANHAPAQALPELPKASTATTGFTEPETGRTFDFSEFHGNFALDQTTNVNQLADVNPGDWAYTAIENLVNRYDCLQGYPNGTFRGNRALSRYEFAAGLNACLQVMEQLLADNLDSLDIRSDLILLKRIMQDFETELAALNGRVDALDARVQFLEDNQFSTTSKLYGQVVVGLQGRLANSVDYLNNTTGNVGSDGITDLSDPSNEISMGYNAQLTLLTQFAPGSYLLLGAQAGNLSTTDDNTSYGLVNNNFLRLGYESNTTNALTLSDANWRKRVTDNFALIVGPAGVNPVNVFRGPSRVESAGFGPISRFAQRNPIIQLGGTSAGAGFDWQVHPQVSLQGVYAAAFANTSTAGLFNDSYTLGLQAFVTPTRTTDIALYFLNGQSGSSQGFLQTGVGDEQVSAINGVDLETNAFGITANWDITDAITLGGWIGWTTSHQLNFDGSVQTNNWMLSLQFPDLLEEGNYGAIFFGVPPRITESNLSANGVLLGNIPSFFRTGSTASQGGRDDTAYHLEAFYRWRLTDNITITPGIVTIFNPGHNANNDTVTIGALRTTLSF
ncbi:MAG: iron uptake porin [Spirulina sp. SIO3F2]|nr:iron uptake porin [Spirulina sp. SIO3F2]